MGQQQLLLIILGVIIVGIAIAVGLSMFSAQSVGANKDAIINGLNKLAADSYQYYPSHVNGRWWQHLLWLYHSGKTTIKRECNIRNRWYPWYTDYV